MNSLAPDDPGHVEWYLQPADAGPSSVSASPSLGATALSAFDDTEAGADERPGEKGKGRSREGKVRSCAPCRIRRVACVRDPSLPATAPCLKCASKGISCSPVPPREKKPLNRTGKRIKLSQAIFGDATGAVPPDLVDAKTESAIPIGSVSAFASAREVLGAEYSQALTVGSAAGRLATSEVQGSLISSLLDFYLSYTKSHPSLLETTAFRQSFDKAGRRMTQMGEQDQVLCSVVMALAARTSDHPLLVGTDSPAVSQLASYAMEGSLAEYGRRRETACRELTDRAVSLADQAGTMRIPSVENVATLLLLEGLVESATADGGAVSATSINSAPRTPHPYAAACNAHAKAILEADLPRGMTQRLSGSVLGYTIYIREVMSASNFGRIPSFSEEDVMLLRGEEEPPLTLLEELVAVPSLDLHVACWRLFSSLLGHIADTAQITSLRLTGLRARRSLYLDEAFAVDYLSRMELSLAALPTIRQRINRLLETEEALHTPQFVMMGKDLLGAVRSLRCAIAGQCFLLSRVIAQRIAGKTGGPAPVFIRWPPLPGPANDDAYWARLGSLEEKARVLSFVAARSIVAVLEEAFASGHQVGSSEWLDARGTSMMFANVSMWQHLLLSTPATEEGGPPGFDYELLRGLNSVGWAYEALSRPAPRIKAEIEKLEQRQAAYWGGIVNNSNTFEAASVDQGLPPMFSEEELQALMAFPVEQYELVGWQGEQQGGGFLAVEQDLFRMSDVHHSDI